MTDYGKEYATQAPYHLQTIETLLHPLPAHFPTISLVCYRAEARTGTQNQQETLHVPFVHT